MAEEAAGNSGTDNNRQSKARFTVHVRDQNDSPPVFTRPAYEVEVPEDLATGETVAWIRATDADSGLYGTAGVRYTRITGPRSEMLQLDSQTGKQEREREKSYLLTF